MIDRILQAATAATYAAVIFLTISISVGAQAVTAALDELDRATPLENWQVISAFLLPLVMAFIIQSGWSRGLQATATLLVSLLVTFVVRILTDETVVVPQLVIQALELFALTIPFYLGLWKPSGVAPAIEARTTL